MSCLAYAFCNSPPDSLITKKGRNEERKKEVSGKIEGKKERMNEEAIRQDRRTESGEGSALLAENTESKPNGAVIILPILSMYFE